MHGLSIEGETGAGRNPRLLLRSARMRDVQDIFAFCKYPDVTRQMTWDAHQAIREPRAMLQAHDPRLSLRHAGKRREGTLCKRLFSKGQYHDMEQYGIRKDRFLIRTQARGRIHGAGTRTASPM